MNKGWKTFLIVCASLCLAGVILGAAGLIKGVAKLVSWDGKGLDGLSVQTQAQPVEQSMALAPFTGLKVEAACDVNLIPCDHDGVEYTVYDRTHLPVIEQDGETVTVSYPGRNGFQLNFSFGQRDRIDIYYEQSRTLEWVEGKITGDADLTLTADSLQLQSTGTVVLQGTVKDVTLRSASGDVDGQIKADTADLQLAAGDLTLHDSALGDAFVRVSSGSIALENVTAAQELRINSSAGSVTAQGGSAQSLLCQSAMGDVTLRGMTVEQLEIQVSAGKIMVDTPQSASDVSVKAQASAGECHLDGSACGKSYLREGGAASWQLVSSAGDIDLTFAK